jgi:hypothetical protein
LRNALAVPETVAGDTKMIFWSEILQLLELCGVRIWGRLSVFVEIIVVIKTR